MRKTIIIAAALLASTAFAAGEVYRWKDANGIVHYSDQQQPGAEVVRNAHTTATKAATPDSTAAPAAGAAAGPTAVTPDSASDTQLPVSKEVAQEVRKEAATAKAEQCEKAKTAYNKYVQAQRITKSDAKGNVTYLTSAEIDAARLQARSTRDELCGS